MYRLLHDGRDDIIFIAEGRFLIISNAITYLSHTCAPLLGAKI